MRPLSDATRRNGVWYLHIRIPEQLRSAYRGERFIRKSLRTKNRSEAAALVHELAAAQRREFAKLLTQSTETEGPDISPNPNSFSDLARQHGREVAERALVARADLYEAAIADPNAFWQSTAIANRRSDDFTYFDKLVADGDLDRITGFVIRQQAVDRIAELKRMVATGNLAEMLALAEARSPGLNRKTQVALAALLARAEISALEGMLSESIDFTQFQPESRILTVNSSAVDSPSISLELLFERWSYETKPSASTLSNWRGHIRSLAAAFPEKAENAASITAQDIITWKDMLVSSGKAAKTINDSYLACVRTLFSFGVNNRLLSDNPGIGVKVAGSRKAGTSRLPYTNSEVARLLVLARGEKHAARRWLPWLAAQTGSRIGEVAQLWGKFVKQEGEIWYLDIRPAPDAGSIKEEVSERHVPIHPALIEEGFLEFVRARGDGPLFYDKSSGNPGRKHASKGVSNHIAEWIRRNGFSDLRKAPNHALRHWFKTEAGRVGIEARLVDKIQGHAPRSQADRYYHPGLRTKLDALRRIRLPPAGESDSKPLC